MALDEYLETLVKEGTKHQHTSQVSKSWRTQTATNCKIKTPELSGNVISLQPISLSHILVQPASVLQLATHSSSAASYVNPAQYI